MFEKTILDRVNQALTLAVQAGLLNQIPAATKITAPERPEHGDWSINVALVAAKTLKLPPRELAARLQPLLEQIADVDRVEIAGPGFLNLFMKPSFEGGMFVDFYRWLTSGANLQPSKVEKILIEFVSANPTGPLHVGHGRGAAVGDSVARLLRRVGHLVTTEYYVNDAGKQMDNLGRSVRARVLEAEGIANEFPEDGYHGDYIRELANLFRQAPAFHGFLQKTATEQIAACRDFAGRVLLDWIRDELKKFRVEFDHWRSELALHKDGHVQAFVNKLKTAGHISQRNGALFFEAERFGDEKSRVVVRENGEPTYFAADIAYHAEKFARGFERILDFWGADHHGYEPRLRAALRALGAPEKNFEVHLIQFVTLLRNGETVSMGKRSGKFEVLGDVVRDVGVDAARFFYLLRRPESHLEFDLDLAKKQANDNPVYYVQYAHARVASLRRLAAERGISIGKFSAADLSHAADRDLLKVVLRYPSLLERAADSRAPHEIVFYLQELAASFHGYYNKQRILDAQASGAIQARLALADAVGRVIADGLSLIGVSAPDRM